MVLITGATGFLGAHLTCLLLKNGQSLRALKRETSSLDSFHFIADYHLGKDKDKYLKNLSWFDADVLDVIELDKALDGISKVYHFAALVSFDKRDIKQLNKVNVEGTANVVNLCLSKGIDKLCYASSTAALGRSLNQGMVSEETEWVDSKENTNYAVSKYLAEMEVWRGQEEGLNVVIVNPSVILGVTNQEVGSAAIIKKAKSGFPFYSKGQNGFVDVEDVSKIMIRLMNSDIIGEQFLLVSENWTFEKLFKTAAKYAGIKPPSICIKPWMAQIAWRLVAILSFFTRKAPMITKETARSSQNIYSYSNSKIVNTLGYKFTPLADTIKKY